MKFLRLPDSLLTPLFEDNDILAIDKPYGFNAHTNDSKVEHSEYIQDGLIEIFEKQLGIKLYIIHRLDQTTTGVMIFGKSPEAAKKYADMFFKREVKKTYLFITGHSSVNKKYLVEKEIIHKAKQLEASTQLNFLKKYEKYELWEAQPATGRNHQIRIHAQVVGIPILGDSKYEGVEFPFICLHNKRMTFPNGIVIDSTPPPYFEDLTLLSEPLLLLSYFEIDRRRRLFKMDSQKEECFRLGNQFISNSLLPQFTLDHLGEKLVLTCIGENWKAFELSQLKSLEISQKKTLVVRKAFSKIVMRFKNEKLEEVAEGQSWVANEGKIKYDLRVDAHFSSGMYLNQRLQRKWILDNSRKKTVLNLFAGNGHFAVNAALGDAAEVTIVESGKSALSWAKKNFEVNGIKLEPNNEKFKFLCRDSLGFLRQSLGKSTKFDLIICEAPRFVRSERGTFKIEKDLNELLRNSLECLNSSGEILFSTAFEGFVINDLHQSILKNLKSLRIPNFEIFSILPSLDFELPDERAHLKSFLIRKN
jgi:23S rRNA G2069 N7-methylase RlmK/C1962 C5-methylase RlmI